MQAQAQDSAEKIAGLKKQSQQLQLQMDNLKIAKEQQYLQLTQSIKQMEQQSQQTSAASVDKVDRLTQQLKQM